MDPTFGTLESVEPQHGTRTTVNSVHNAIMNELAESWCYHDVYTVIDATSKLTTGHRLSRQVPVPLYPRPTPQVQKMARWQPTIPQVQQTGDGL
jgi:energy-converting hydrogenase Eha subunit F